MRAPAPLKLARKFSFILLAAALVGFGACSQADPSAQPTEKHSTSDKTENSVFARNLSDYDCETLWESFAPLEMEPLPILLARDLSRRKGIVHPDVYYPDLLDIDNDGIKEIIAVKKNGFSPPVSGGSGSAVASIHFSNYTPERSIEAQLLEGEYEGTSYFFGHISNSVQYTIESEIENLPAFHYGTVQIGTVGEHILLKINADTFETRAPAGANPQTYIRAYDILGQLKPLRSPNKDLAQNIVRHFSLNIFCFKKRELTEN